MMIKPRMTKFSPRKLRRQSLVLRSPQACQTCSKLHSRSLFQTYFLLWKLFAQNGLNKTTHFQDATPENLKVALTSSGFLQKGNFMKSEIQSVDFAGSGSSVVSSRYYWKCKTMQNADTIENAKCKMQNANTIENAGSAPSVVSSRYYWKCKTMQKSRL